MYGGSAFQDIPGRCVLANDIVYWADKPLATLTVPNAVPNAAPNIASFSSP